MSVEIDSKGLAVVLTPRGRSGALESLAIPLSGAEPLVSVLQAKIAEAKANAESRPTRRTRRSSRKYRQKVTRIA